MQSVYIETTIPSYYFETRRSPTVVAWRTQTRHWWDRCSADYHLFTSRFVLAELTLAPESKARRAIQLLQPARVLDETPDLDDIVAFYVAHKLMPAEAGGDAVHLALASLYKIDYLLTWNCRHLANANKTQHLRVLNARLGLHVPIVTTPLTLIPEAQ